MRPVPSSVARTLSHARLSCKAVSRPRTRDGTLGRRGQAWRGALTDALIRGRLATAFRIFTIIPIAILAATIEGGSFGSQAGGEGVRHTGGVRRA
jgi:hypothetical protein